MTALRNARIKAGLSMAALGARLSPPVPRQRIHEWESGRVQMSLRAAVQIAQILGLSPEQLMLDGKSSDTVPCPGCEMCNGDPHALPDNSICRGARVVPAPGSLIWVCVQHVPDHPCDRSGALQLKQRASDEAR